MLVGNAIDGGTENAKERISESHFPWLAANALDREGNYYTGDGILALLRTRPDNLSEHKKLKRDALISRDLCF